MNVEPVSWDSQFFKLRIGKLQLAQNDSVEEALTLLQETTNFDLVYIFSPQPIALPNLDKRCTLIDEKVVYKRDAHSVFKANKHCNTGSLREYTDRQPTAALINLALQSGWHSRFYRDQNFPKGAFVKLYTEWISKSTDKTLADKVFISEVNNQLAGFITLSIKKEECSIGLIAVDEHYRNLGIGQQLMSKVIETFAETRATKLTVATQKQNLGACKFYEKNGFDIQEETNIYHFWYSIL